MQKNFLIVGQDKEIAVLINLAINEKVFIDYGILKKISIESKYEVLLQKQDIDYDFIFLDPEHFTHDLKNILKALRQNYPKAYYIIIEKEKEIKMPHIRSIILGTLTIKNNFNYESFAEHLSALIEIAEKNKDYIQRTDKLLSICNDIENFYTQNANLEEFENEYVIFETTLLDMDK